jgi:hypothetical protein
VLEAAGEWSRRLQSEADDAAALSGLVDKVNLKPGGIELSINLPLPVDGTHGAAAMLPITQACLMPEAFPNAVPVCEGLGAGRGPLCQCNCSAPLLNSRPPRYAAGATMTEAQALGLFPVSTSWTVRGD